MQSAFRTCKMLVSIGTRSASMSFRISARLFIYRLLGKPNSELARGVRGVNILESRASRLVDCLAVQIDPQASSEMDFNPDRLYHILVLKCENELATVVINGANMQLRSGDHLVLKPNTSFQFINSSLSHPLKLRILFKTRTFPLSDENQALN